MMSRNDYEQVADVIFSLDLRSSVPHVSAGMRRRTVALAFARAFDGEKWFDKDKFMMRAEHGV